MSAHDGYGGFNYVSDVLYMNSSTWTAPNGTGYTHHWCDTGYQNVAGTGTSEAWIYSYGLMESASTSTFSAIKLTAASSWSNNAQWDIISYTESNGSLVVKATDLLTISQTAEKVKFSKLGGKGDFKGISAIAFSLVSEGSYGNTCTYGGATLGLQLCLTNLKVKFSKGSGANNGNHLVAPAHHHQLAPHVAAHQALATHSDAGVAHSHSDGHHVNTGYHSQLLSLGHESGGLTNQFHLPAVEHFGV